MTFWIECGRIQGKICTQLYTPAAFALSDEDRARLARDLADELELIYQRKRESNVIMTSTFDRSREAFQWTDAWIHSDGIDYYSTL